MPPSSPPMAGGRRNPRTVRIVVVLIAIILAISGAVVFYVLTQSSACNFSSTDPLIFDQPERPDTLDPHVTFSTPGWGIVQQIYQTLVNYNGSSYTTYVPVLAKSWSVSADNLTSGCHLLFGGERERECDRLGDKRPELLGLLQSDDGAEGAYGGGQQLLPGRRCLHARAARRQWLPRCLSVRFPPGVHFRPDRERGRPEGDPAERAGPL